MRVRLLEQLKAKLNLDEEFEVLRDVWKVKSPHDNVSSDFEDDEDVGQKRKRAVKKVSIQIFRQRVELIETMIANIRLHRTRIVEAVESIKQKLETFKEWYGKVASYVKRYFLKESKTKLLYQIVQDIVLERDGEMGDDWSPDADLLKALESFCV
ncbi:hypothetical protein BC829DRAFT_401814 [Chytridium lagenaria]|nr:hypothetical protein BC829DRAFT_401814 [Chytridium lagenaria]